MKHVLLNSGGMDSFLVGFNTEMLDASVFVDVGQKYADKERESARRIARIFELDHYELNGAYMGGFEHPSGIIPFRNAEMIICAAQVGEVIYMGVLEGEINSDKSPEFFRSMETMLNISHRKQYWTEGREFRIETPLANGSKADHLKRLRDSASQAVWDALLETVSCYDAGDRHCGRCASCFKRWVALNVATGKDHSDMFASPPALWRALGYYRDQYSGKRLFEIEQAYRIYGES